MFNVNLKNLREEENLTQEQLAKDMGVQKSSISNWETGKATPTFEMLTKLANYFNVSIDYLLDFNQDDYDKIEKLKQTLKKAGLMVGDDLTQEEFDKVIEIANKLRGEKENV